MIMTTDLEPPKKTRWETKLARKGAQTARAYKKHVKDFIKAMGHAKYFTQDNIDDYLHQLRQEDEKKPNVKKYS